MLLKDKKIGFCITGSFCTLDKALQQIKKLKEHGADIYPVFSYTVATTDTRYTTAKNSEKR